MIEMLIVIVLLLVFANIAASSRAHFYFVRHGESDGNKKGVLQGQLDYPLTTQGCTQGGQVGSHIENINFQKVYSSDLTRASHTCEIILSGKSRKSSFVEIPLMKKTHLLRECRFGIREGKNISFTVHQVKTQIAEKLQIKIEDVVDSSETLNELDQRQQVFLHNVFDELEKEEDAAAAEKQSSQLPPPKILCVTHSAYIKGLMELNFGIVLDTIHNCSITKVTITRDEQGHLHYSIGKADEDVNNNSHMC